MPGIAVGDHKLDLDPEKLMALADRLHYAQTIGDRTVAAAEAVLELRRIADGVIALKNAHEEMVRTATAIAVQTLVEVFQPAECQCQGCIERRAREAKGEPCNCATCKAKREAQARRMN